MTTIQSTIIMRYIDEGVRLIGAEKDPYRGRTIVDSYVDDQLRKSHPPEFKESLAAMDVQDLLNAHPGVPNLPVRQVAGTPGVEVISSQNIVTSAELARQIEVNNQKLLAAMAAIIQQAKNPSTQESTSSFLDKAPEPPNK